MQHESRRCRRAGGSGWPARLIGGAFQGYTLGNVLSAQFFEAALGSDGSVEEGIGARGDG